MTLKSVYLLIYDDQEGGGDIYHRVFADRPSAEAALFEIRDEVLDRNIMSQDDMLEYEARCDYEDNTNRFYLVDAADVTISKHTLEGSQ